MKFGLFFTNENFFYCDSSKNPQNDLVYAPVAAKQRDVMCPYSLLCMQPTFSESVRSRLQYQNFVISTSSSLKLGLKLTGSIAEK